MKTLIAFAAAAALAGGISVAGAQSSMQKSNDMEVTGSSAFCAQSAQGNALDCKFASMSACQQDTKVKADSAECIQNPNQATTGAASDSGSNGSMSGSSSSTGGSTSTSK